MAEIPYGDFSAGFYKRAGSSRREKLRQAKPLIPNAEGETTLVLLAGPTMRLWY